MEARDCYYGTVMSIAYVQSISQNYSANNSNTFPTQFTSNCTSGNQINVIVLASSVCTMNSVTDDSHNNYQLAGQLALGTSGADPVFMAMYFAPNIQVGSTPKITVSANVTYAGTGFVWIAAHEYSGLGLWSPLDGYAWNAYGNTSLPSNSPSASSNPVPTVVADELIFAAFYSSSADRWSTAGTTFTGRENGHAVSNIVPSDILTMDKVISAIALVQATAQPPNPNTNTVGLVATFANITSVDRVQTILEGDAQIR